MSLTFSGVGELRRNLLKIRGRVNRNMVDSLEEMADEILEDSRDLAPVDTGAMVGNSEVVETAGGEFEIQYNEDYAIYVHEDMEANHPNGGQAKFLSTAVNNKKRETLQKIKKELLK